jgi:predicted CopG family antitoxin
LFSSSAKIKIDKSLYDRLARMAEGAGYSSTEEFITHLLEREVASLDESSSDKEVEDRLRGLGYIE